jgi:hypothetical protein
VKVIGGRVIEVHFRYDDDFAKMVKSRSISGCNVTLRRGDDDAY